MAFIPAGKKNYHYWQKRGNKRVRISTGTSSKKAAHRIEAAAKEQEALRDAGLIDPSQERLAQARAMSIAHEIDSYIQSKRSAGKSANHIKQVELAIYEATAYCDWRSIGDIAPEGLSSWGATLAEKGGKGKGGSVRSVQRRVGYVKSFTKHLVRYRKLPFDPLAEVKTPTPTFEAHRRMLLPDEWQCLKKSTAAGPVREGMQPAERALLYQLAIETGLRSKELRSLTLRKIQADAEQPHVLVRGASTKNEKDAKQYITEELATKLLEHIAPKSLGSPVFDMPHEANCARMIRADLTAARCEWLETLSKRQRKAAEQSDFLAEFTSEGERFDLHSLRHTTGAWLAQRGVNPKTIQTVMRHSTIRLTLDTYGHMFPGEEAAAVATLAQWV